MKLTHALLMWSLAGPMAVLVNANGGQRSSSPRNFRSFVREKIRSVCREVTELKQTVGECCNKELQGEISGVQLWRFCSHFRRNLCFCCCCSLWPTAQCGNFTISLFVLFVFALLVLVIDVETKWGQRQLLTISVNRFWNMSDARETASKSLMYGNAQLKQWFQTVWKTGRLTIMEPSFRLQTGAVPVCVITVRWIALMPLAAIKVNRVSNLFGGCCLF